jgi:hypothetical protein
MAVIFQPFDRFLSEFHHQVFSVAYQMELIKAVASFTFPVNIPFVESKK